MKVNLKRGVTMNNIIDRINHDNLTKSLKRETITVFLHGDWTGQLDVIKKEYNCNSGQIHICMYYKESNETFINIVKG